jgi:SH3-like domain-containing protein
MNNKIKPKYINFEQAKGFSELGFNLQCPNRYNQQGEILDASQLLDSLKDFESFDAWMKNKEENYYKCPEQHQVVEWLRLNHGIWVEVLTEKSLFIFQIKKIGKEGFIAGKFENTPQEAYSAAFDYVLNNNLI